MQNYTGETDSFRKSELVSSGQTSLIQNQAYLGANTIISITEKDLSDSIDSDVEKLIDWVFECKSCGNFTSINSFLKSIDFMKIHPLMIETILRSTFHLRNFLPDWNTATNKAIGAFIDRKIPLWMLDGIIEHTHIEAN